MIGFLRKNFPATVSSDTVKKLGLAPKNESYVINVLQHLGLIDEEGKRTEKGHGVMTTHDEAEFEKAFSDLTRAAYADLFDLRGDDAWAMDRNSLISFFRSADKTSDIIGQRQAGVFMALRDLSGYKSESQPNGPKPKSGSSPRSKTKAKPVLQAASPNATSELKPAIVPSREKGEMALTVRIEINLPAEGTQATYDAIFKSIRANLFP
ncbi:hypothetical protein BHK69_23635 [Bosea vaviloviae]|uniref:DUF5343 domain-containing protein n=2 Tax=Bosea vaviloviae TaxID=1526658 RepID=A0A1D7UBH5_9HYPH|nr:hypothetical protein BHK69_23635 [Bosea vaviloviae]